MHFAINTLLQLHDPEYCRDPEYCHIINDGALNPFIVRTNPARVRPEREPENMYRYKKERGGRDGV